MKFPDDLEIEISPDGTITSLYIDGLAEELGADILNVERASHVTWDPYSKGWSVTGAGPGYSCIVCVMPGKYAVSYDHPSNVSACRFKSREEAIKVEKKFYRQLMMRR